MTRAAVAQRMQRAARALMIGADDDSSFQHALDAFPRETSEQRDYPVTRARVARERGQERLLEFLPTGTPVRFDGAIPVSSSRLRRRSRTRRFVLASLPRRPLPNALVLKLTASAAFVAALVASWVPPQPARSALPATMVGLWVPLVAPAVVAIERPLLAPLRDRDAVVPGEVPPPGGGKAPRDTVVIQRALNQYRDALSTFDVAMMKAIWPTVDESALRKAFAGLYDQNVEFDACRISVAAATANAVCQGSVNYARTRNLKQRRSEFKQWQFALVNDGDRWIIQTAVDRSANDSRGSK